MTKLLVNRHIHSLLILIALVSVLFMTPIASAMNDREKQNIADMKLFIGLMNEHIEMINSYYETANKPECVAAFAVMEIKSLYEDRGDTQGAIKQLQKLLKQTDNKTVRSVIRLQLNDLLKSAGDKEAAQKNLEELIKENL